MCQSVEGGEEVKEAARCVSGKSAWRVSRASSRPPLASLGQHSLLEVPPLKNSARPMRLTGLIFALPPRRTRTVPRGGRLVVIAYGGPWQSGQGVCYQATCPCNVLNVTHKFSSISQLAVLLGCPGICAYDHDTPAPCACTCKISCMRFCCKYFTIGVYL